MQPRAPMSVAPHPAPDGEPRGLPDSGRRYWLALGLLGACSASPVAGAPRALPTATPVSAEPGSKRLSLSALGGCVLQNGSVSCWSVAPEAAGSGAPIRPSPVPLPESTTAVDGTLAFGCAVLESHAVYCWGDNAWGQLGAGSRTARSDVPLRAVGLDDATSIAVGEAHACATRASGSVACWGSNWAGQCGHDFEYASAVRQLVVPTNVAGLGGIEHVSVGRYATCALGAGGVACWGAILQTPEGLARAPDRTRPTPFEALSSARSIELGDDCGCALLHDGRVACFGVGPHGCPSLDPLIGLQPLFDGQRLERLVVGEGGACAAFERGGWYCWQHPGEPIAQDVPPSLAYVPRSPQAAPFALTDDVAYGHEPCALGAASLRCLEPNEGGKVRAVLREVPMQ
jgi:hypothetical protein